MTDTCIKMFQSLFGSLLNHLYHYANLYFNYHLLAPKTVQFMEELAVFTALNHSGSFGMNFVKFGKNYHIFFSFRGHGNESCNLIGSLLGQYFPISAHGSW